MWSELLTNGSVIDKEDLIDAVKSGMLESVSSINIYLNSVNSVPLQIRLDHMKSLKLLGIISSPDTFFETCSLILPIKD